jgi:hypothetical protein
MGARRLQRRKSVDSGRRIAGRLLGYGAAGECAAGMIAATPTIPTYYLFGTAESPQQNFIEISQLT